VVLSGPPPTTALALIRARRALAAAGLDPTLPLERAASATNEVWYAGRYVLRLGPRGDGRLSREAELVPLVPGELGYPPVVAAGSDASVDWLITRRVPGLPLSRCWPGMDDDRRERAVHQVAAKLAALHRTQADLHLPPPLRAPQLLDPAARGGRRAVLPLLAALDRAVNLPFVDRRVLADAADLARTTATALDPWPAPGMVHGDVHFENVLWDGRSVTAVLDLEWCRPGPPDLDLDVLLRFCELPFLHVAPDYEHLTRAEDYQRVPWWLADAYPDLFTVPRQLDRMRLYALAFDTRDLLDDPPRRPVRELSGQHAWHRLVRTVSGTSHLDRLALAIR
jgi:Ser/Thr protein kinase RdoA (MazF antagonist)